MNRIKICIVEDNQEIRTGLKMIINNSPELECDCDFPNAEDAINHLSINCKDVVLMDIDLPGQDGITATRQLLTANPAAQGPGTTRVI